MMIEGLIGITKSSYTGDDLISREQAIDSWDKLSKRGRTEFDQVLMTLPSADKVTGHIVTKYSGEINPTIWAECSECGKSIDPWDRFCRYCGAKMVANSE